jgi:hypothetical protein
MERCVVELKEIMSQKSKRKENQGGWGEGRTGHRGEVRVLWGNTCPSERQRD